MLKNVASGFVIIVLFVFSLGLAGNLFQSDAQGGERTLKNLFDEAYENETLIVTEFISPIAGETEYWIIPEEVRVGDSTMLRTLYEIGSDYFCVQEAGEGARDIKCIPYSNISEIAYNRDG